MKRGDPIALLLALGLGICLGVCLAACGPETEPSGPASEATASEATASEATASEGAAAEDDARAVDGDLPPLPEIAAGRVSEEAGELLARARATVDELRRREASPGELAAAYGRLGETAHAYDFDDLALASYARAARLDPAAGEWAYLRGVVLAENGRVEGARQAFATRIDAAPEDWAALLRRAEADLDLGNTEAAREAFRRVLESGPRDTRAAAHYGLGRLASAAGRAEEAVEHLEAALELQPEAANLHSLLATAYRRLGDRSAAEDHARRFGGGTVDFPDPLLERVESRIEGAGAHVEAAFLAAQDDRYDDALAEYLRALELDPESSTALRGVARSHRELGDFDASLRDYETLLALDPGDAVARAERATLLMEMGRHDESIAAFERLLADEPDFVEALLNLGIVYLRDERWDDAAKVFSRVLELEPGSPDGRYRLALAREGQGRADDALELLRRLVRDTPTHVPGRQTLGRLLEARGDLDGALEQYRTILGLDGLPAPEAALAQYQIGRLLSLRGRPAAAEESVRRALEVLPELQPARFALGNFLRRRGAFAEAAEAYRRVAAADPRNVAARELEVECLMRAGRFAEAAERVDVYLEAAPRSAQLGHQKARLLALGPPGVGDAAAALELADAIFQAHQSLEHAETLVMALAAAGRHDEAAARQQDLVGRAQAADRRDLLPRLRANLERYRQGLPPRLDD